jgi:hypothetical protein
MAVGVTTPHLETSQRLSIYLIELISNFVPILRDCRQGLDW